MVMGVEDGFAIGQKIRMPIALAGGGPQQNFRLTANLWHPDEVSVDGATIDVAVMTPTRIDQLARDQERRTTRHWDLVELRVPTARDPIESDPPAVGRELRPYAAFASGDLPDFIPIRRPQVQGRIGRCPAGIRDPATIGRNG